MEKRKTKRWKSEEVSTQLIKLPPSNPWRAITQPWDSFPQCKDQALVRNTMTTRKVITKLIPLLTWTPMSVHVVVPNQERFTSPLKWNQKLSLPGKLLFRTISVIAQLSFQMVPTTKTSKFSFPLITLHTRKDREDTSHAVELRVIWKERRLNSLVTLPVTLASSNLYGPQRIQESNSCVQISKSLAETLRTALDSAWMEVCVLTVDASAEKDIQVTSVRSENLCPIVLTTLNIWNTSYSSS